MKLVLVMKDPPDHPIKIISGHLYDATPTSLPVALSRLQPYIHTLLMNKLSRAKRCKRLHE